MPSELFKNKNDIARKNMYLKGLLQRQAHDRHSRSDSHGYSRETLEATWRRLHYATTTQRKTM